MRFAGARFLGREIADICKASGKLKNSINGVLLKLQKGLSYSDIDEMFKDGDQHILKMKMVREMHEEFNNY